MKDEFSYPFTWPAFIPQFQNALHLSRASRDAALDICPAHARLRVMEDEKRHLIIGASGGIGSAVADSLNGEVVRLSRSENGLDLTDETSIAARLGPLKGTFDTIFVATGALVVDGHEPEKTIRSLAPEALLGQFRVNAMGPMLVLKHALRLMPKNRRCVFAALSARVGSIGDNQMGGWYSYRTAKSALNQLIHGAAIEVARSHNQAICVCLHPGTVETPFTEKYAGHTKTVTPAWAAENLRNVMDGLEISDTGGFFDYAGTRIEW